MKLLFIACQLILSAVVFNAAIFAVNAAPASNYFNVRDFGAAGNGTNLDSPAINRTIATAAKAGGGTIYFPAGIYLSGSVHLQSNIHLLIDAGAMILGAPQDSNAYDPAEPFAGKAYQDAGHTYFHNSLIWGENLTNIAITGQGMINGGGLEHDSKVAPPTTANKSICLKLCRNVLLRDVTICHGGWFAVLVTGCDNLTVDNVTIDTQRDGIDIDCCRNTTVSNCHINSPNDDGLCPKSTYALGEARITENLTIVNCQVSGFTEGTLLDGTMKPSKNHNGRIKFGTESSGGFRNCTVANCTFRNCRGLALEEVDGGILENITINNLTMMDVPDYAIYITTGKRNRTPGLTTNSRAKNILISNVIAAGVGKMSGIQISGLPEQPVEGVRLENIRLISNGGGTAKDAAINPKELGIGYPEPGAIGTLPAYGIFARHVRDLELANIRVSFLTNDLRPAAFFADVQGLEIDNFKPQVAVGVQAAVIADNVGGISIRNSPALQK
jgi:polygalacturonase